METNTANVIAAKNAEAISPDGVIQEQEPIVVQPPEPKKEVEQKVEEQIEEQTPSVDLFDAFLEKKNVQAEVPKKIEEKHEPEEVQRDFTGIDQNDIPLFRKMSNASFERLKPIYIESQKQKELIKQRDEELAVLKQKANEVSPSVYQHEEGYVLDPGFRKTYQDFTTAQAVANHWEKQLVEIQSGAKTVKLVEFNPQTKAFEVTREVEATPQTELFIQRQLNKADQFVAQQQQRVSEAISNHKNSYNGAASVIQQMEKAYFAKLEDPSYKPIVDQQLNNIPAIYRSHPLASAYAKSLAMNAVLAKLFTEQQSKIQTKRPSAGPSAAEAASDGNGKSSNENLVTMSDFDRVKGGY